MTGLFVHAPPARRSLSFAGASTEAQPFAGQTPNSQHDSALGSALPTRDVRVAALAASAAPYKAIQIFREPGLAMTEAFRSNEAANKLLQYAVAQRCESNGNKKLKHDETLMRAESLARHACANAANMSPTRYSYSEALKPVACKLLCHFTLAEILATRGGAARRDQAVEQLCLALQAATVSGLSGADQQRFITEHAARVRTLVSDPKVQAILLPTGAARAIDGPRTSLLSRLQGCFARLCRRIGHR